MSDAAKTDASADGAARMKGVTMVKPVVYGNVAQVLREEERRGRPHAPVDGVPEAVRTRGHECVGEEGALQAARKLPEQQPDPDEAAV